MVRSVRGPLIDSNRIQ